MRRKLLQWVAGALLLALGGVTPVEAAPTPPAPPPTVSLSLGAEYASGRYGGDATIRSVYLPLIATWLPDDRWDLSLEIPYIYQSGGQVVTDLYRNSQGLVTRRPTGRGGSGSSRSAALQPPAGTDPPPAAATGAVSGLGDIIARVGVIARYEGTRMPQLRPSLFLKFPTAAAEDGLGTGEFDAGLGIEAARSIGKVHLAGEGFWVYQGPARGLDLNNYFSFTAQAGYRLTAAVEPRLILKGATAPVEGSGHLLEGRAGILWAPGGAIALDLYGAAGLSEASPDVGGGLTVIYSF